MTFCVKAIIVLCLMLSFPCSAQELIDYSKEDVRHIKADIDKDGVEEEISAISGELEPGHYVCIISIKDDKNLITKAIEIDMITSYNLSLIEVHPSLEPFIGINYGTGAHSNKLVLFKYVDHGGGYLTLEKTAIFSSDRPSIRIEDIDKDGVKEIVTIYRDYEINPVEESYIQIFEYVDEGKWKVESVYRTATDEFMAEDWDKDKVDMEAYMANMKKFGMYEPEGLKEE